MYIYMYVCIYIICIYVYMYIHVCTYLYGAPWAASAHQVHYNKTCGDAVVHESRLFFAYTPYD